MKEYIRYCDTCGEKIYPYSEGTVTLYRDIRFGVGHRYKDFMNKDEMALELPDDFDGFGKRWTSADDNEFSFCCLDHCLQFICEAYAKVHSKEVKT